MISELGSPICCREGNGCSSWFPSIKAFSATTKRSRRQQLTWRLNKLEMCSLTHDHCFLESTAHFVTRRCHCHLTQHDVYRNLSHDCSVRTWTIRIKFLKDLAQNRLYSVHSLLHLTSPVFLLEFVFCCFLVKPRTLCCQFVHLPVHECELLLQTSVSLLGFRFDGSFHRHQFAMPFIVRRFESITLRNQIMEVISPQSVCINFVLRPCRSQ